MPLRMLKYELPCLVLSILLAGCGVTPNSLTSRESDTAPAITVQPSTRTVTVGQPATFSVMATGSSSLSYQWQKGGAAISGATSAGYTTPRTAASDSGSQFTVVVSSSAGDVISNAATLTVTLTTTDLLTYHNDLARTGQNPTESILTPGNVASATFGMLGFFAAD